jgi:RpiR family murPQ operon transcriptional repressor
MKSVLVRLNEHLNQASPVEYSVAKYLLGNTQEAVNMNIHELASSTFSSPSSILRLCRKLGFKGYKDFRQAMLCELVLRKESASDAKKKITRSDSIEEIVDKITYRNIVALETTKNLIDINILSKCVELIDKSHNVCLFGMGSSLIVARDMYLKLLRLNKPCTINDDWHSQLLQARNMSKEDLGIVFSYSGQTVEVIECMKIMRNTGCEIIAITRFASSPVAELSSYNIYVPADESTFRSGAMSSRISQLNIIDILFTAYANRQYEYSIEQLSKTHIDKTKPFESYK